MATSVGTVFKRRDLQEYDELSSDEYDDSDYQDDGSYEEEQYDDTYQDDEYDDGSYEEEQYDDGYEAESGPYDNENNEAYFSDQSDEKPVKKKSIANKNPWRNDFNLSCWYCGCGHCDSKDAYCNKAG